MKPITSIFTIAIAIGTLSATPWPQYLGPNGNGVSQGEIPAAVQKNGPKKLWEANVGYGCSSFVIADGRALTLGNANDSDTLWCFEAQTGKVLWKATYPEKLEPKFYDGGPGATPTIHQGLVYNLSKSGRLSCHDLKTGKEKWKVHFNDDLNGIKPTWGYSASPVVYGDTLLCLPCAKGASMVALDLKTGKVVWKSSDSARPGYAAPVFFQHKGNDAALVFHGRSLVGYDLTKKGAVLFEYPWRTPYDINASNPLIQGDFVHISSGYNMGYAVLDISKNPPELVHRDRNLPMIFQNAFLEDGDVIGCFGDKQFKTQIYRMDLKTGKVHWTHDLPGTRGSTAKIGETLVVLTETGHLVFGNATPKKFEETGRHLVLESLCWAPLAISEGKLFARTNKGKAICLALTE